ncbi:MAG TPA: DUF3017 domain-containing protein [Actinocrinis sp.]|nr:DUF3017 domain-containing protein [Actinocrinis sp.]
MDLTSPPAADHHAGPGPAGLLRAVLGQWPFAVVFAGALAGIGLVALGALQHGLIVLAGAVVLGSVLRFAIPASRVGLLAVRRRGADVITMALLGVVLLVLAAVVDTR